MALLVAVPVVDDGAVKPQSSAETELLLRERAGCTDAVCGSRCTQDVGDLAVTGLRTAYLCRVSLILG